MQKISQKIVFFRKKGFLFLIFKDEFRNTIYTCPFAVTPLYFQTIFQSIYKISKIAYVSFDIGGGIFHL